MKSDNEEQLTAIQFPCDFMVKVIGKNHEPFENKVLVIIKQHFPKLANGGLKKKLSKNKSYLSLSFTVHAESKQQLDALYQSLSDEPEVLFAL